jgi:hypothetical protein
MLDRETKSIGILVYARARRGHGSLAPLQVVTLAEIRGKAAATVAGRRNGRQMVTRRGRLFLTA